jgi:DNA-binding XRE family transcriptional regulator
LAELKCKPVRHDHARFLAKAKQRPGFAEAYESIELKYALASQLLKTRAKAGLTQDGVAERMGTTKSAASRLEAVGRYAPSYATLKKYAAAVACDLQVRLVPQKLA